MTHETPRIPAESGTGTGVAMGPLMKTAEMPIKSPCDVDWASMNPRKTGRFCGDCKKVVQDLSSMKQADAKRRVAEAPEGLCIRYLHDEHGNIWFKDTPLVAAGNLLKKSASLVAAIALTLRQRKDSRSQDPSQQVRAKKADRLRIVKVDVVRDLPSLPPAAPTAGGDKS